MGVEYAGAHTDTAQMGDYAGGARSLNKLEARTQQ